MHSIKLLHLLKSCILTLCFIFPFALQGTALKAAPLDQAEATQIMADTITISGYLALKGEESYKDKPQNVLRAAIFAAYNAKMEFNLEQSVRKEDGEELLPPTSTIFAVGGKKFLPDDVLSREDNPELFEGIPEQYGVFVTKNGVELAALQFTGHKVSHPQKLECEGFLCDSIPNSKGYYANIEGLGDLGVEPELMNVQETKNGFILEVKLVQTMGEESEAPKFIRLELTPGEAPGTWKTKYLE